MGNITWAPSPIAGIGVFATSPIAAGEVIEVCPVVIVPAEQRPPVDATVLYNYYFEWADGNGALALGLGSLYNHCEHANAKWYKDFIKGTVTYKAILDIMTGDEIVVCYGATEDLWFPARQDPISQPRG